MRSRSSETNSPNLEFDHIQTHLKIWCLTLGLTRGLRSWRNQPSQCSGEVWTNTEYNWIESNCFYMVSFLQAQSKLAWNTKLVYRSRKSLNESPVGKNALVKLFLEKKEKLWVKIVMQATKTGFRCLKVFCVSVIVH